MTAREGGSAKDGGKGTKSRARSYRTPKAALAVRHELPPYPLRWAFLKAYEACGTITGAADALGIGRRLHYRWVNEEGPAGDAYRQAFADSHARVVHSLEEEAIRRATQGTMELVVDRGQPVMVGVTADGRVVREDHPDAVTVQALVKKKKSDALLIFLLKGKDPHQFGDRRAVEVSGPAGGPVQVEATVEERTDAFSAGFWELMDLAGVDPAAVSEGGTDES